MGYPTLIEWTDATWNPVGGCEILTPGCINCYAQALAASPRLCNHPVYSGVTKVVKGKPVFNGMLTALPDDHAGWDWPLRWRGAKDPKLGAGKPSMIFVGDMADLFHKKRAVKVIDRVVGAIMGSRHIGQFLSKRSDVMAEYFNSARTAHQLAHGGWHPRVWLGFSAERQEEFDARWWHMRSLAQAGWQVFVSIEPQLGRICLPVDFLTMAKKPWVIAGGESGTDARAPHPDWFRLLRDQTQEYGVPFLFKQWGEWAFEGQRDSHGKRLVWSHDAESMQRIGKKKAGRLLDGVEFSQFPKVGP